MLLIIFFLIIPEQLQGTNEYCEEKTVGLTQWEP